MTQWWSVPSVPASAAVQYALLSISMQGMTSSGNGAAISLGRGAEDLTFLERQGLRDHGDLASDRPLGLRGFQVNDLRLALNVTLFASTSIVPPLPCPALAETVLSRMTTLLPSLDHDITLTPPPVLSVEMRLSFCIAMDFPGVELNSPTVTRSGRGDGALVKGNNLAASITILPPTSIPVF